MIGVGNRREGDSHSRQVTVTENRREGDSHSGQVTVTGCGYVAIAMQ